MPWNLTYQRILTFSAAVEMTQQRLLGSPLLQETRSWVKLCFENQSWGWDGRQFKGAPVWNDLKKVLVRAAAVARTEAITSVQRKAQGKLLLMMIL